MHSHTAGVPPEPAAISRQHPGAPNSLEFKLDKAQHYLGSRLLSVQALRAVAALLVVWVHAIDAAEMYSAPRQSRFFHWENYGACGVDIFFAISGFIVSQVAVRLADRNPGTPSASAREFLTRRITRIFPLYWILTAVVIAIDELGKHPIQWHSFHWIPTLLLFPSLHALGNAPALSLGWSLMFEMYFYLILTIFMIWTPSSLVRNTTVFLCGMVILGTLVNIHRPFIVIWMNPIVLEFVFGCLIGLMFSHSIMTSKIKKIGVSVAVIGAILLAATIFTGYGQASEQDWILAGYYSWLRVVVWGVPAALLVGGVIFWNPKMRSAPARLLVFLGDASYSIYLCTIPARSIVEHFWRFFGRFGADTGVFLGALFCTVVGVICYLLLERPLMRAFHNWYKPIPLHIKHAAVSTPMQG
jgi:exopolysaccharide production protein ExoZ